MAGHCSLRLTTGSVANRATLAATMSTCLIIHLISVIQAIHLTDYDTEEIYPGSRNYTGVGCYNLQSGRRHVNQQNSSDML